MLWAWKFVWAVKFYIREFSAPVNGFLMNWESRYHVIEMEFSERLSNRMVIYGETEISATRYKTLRL